VRRSVVPILALVALAAVLAVPVVAHRGSSSSQVVQLSFHSRAVNRQLHLSAYLPPGYATSGLRYPVVYFLHGLPAPPTAYKDIAWLQGPLDALSRRAILVAPQAAADEDSDPEYLDWGPGRNWETAIAKEVPSYVDSHLRAIPTRRGRALAGLSAGGYGAVILALHHLDDFAAIESWSGYFHPTNPAGTAALDLGSSAKNARASAHSFVTTLRADSKRRPTFFAFYVGSRDARFRAENVQLARELRAAHVPHVFAVYSGAHEQSVWKAHAKAWLELAVDHLARAQR
jgi:S-formylglutathione hydrolase FrmB